MHPLAETLLNEPVIAAVKTDEALTAALASPCSAVFLLASTLLTVDGLVHRIHDAGKLAVVHIDLVDGLSSREIAVDSLNALCHPAGIISTRPTLNRRTRHRGLLPDQRGGVDIIDLANRFSCAFIQTQDVGRVSDDGSFRIEGRIDHSDIRGCNLLVQ